MNGFDFDKIPDNAGSSEITDGIYVLDVINCEYIISSTGSKMLQFTYKIQGSNVEVRYDNCVVENKEGNPNNVGLVKLKKIVSALGLKSTFSNNIVSYKDMPTIIKAVPRSLKAEVKKDEKGYFKLGSFDLITGLQTSTPEDFLDESEKNTPSRINMTSNWG